MGNLYIGYRRTEALLGCVCKRGLIMNRECRWHCEVDICWSSMSGEVGGIYLWGIIPYFLNLFTKA